jgi:hypothetical protein
MLMQRLMLLMFLFFQNICVLEKEKKLLLYVATCVRHGITVGVLIFRWTRTRQPGIVPLCEQHGPERSCQIFIHPGCACQTPPLNLMSEN